MESRVLTALLAAALVLASPSARGLGFDDPGPAAEVAARITAAMTDEELLGQVMMLGYPGPLAESEIPRWIRERRIGGVKIFPRNVEDLPSLAVDIAAMQRLATGGRFAIPLFVSTDQEGGWVRQIKGETSIGPGNLALGASGSAADALWTGYYLGRELATLGINMNFAPTADVYANPEASVIGPRSFGSDPALTGLLSAAYARGMRRAGVLCTAKHFPGHGSADKDSHGRLPVIPAGWDLLSQRDLLPYRILVREGIPAIMSGHLAFPDILGGLTPASLSPFFMHSVLRDRLGFTGLVITDDMEMEGALVGGLDTATACRRALEAGNDIVLISHTPAVQEKTWRALTAEMKRSRAFRAVVAGSARRVLEHKIAYFRDGSAAGLAPTARAARTEYSRGRRAGVLLPERLPQRHPAAGREDSLAATARGEGPAVRAVPRVPRGGQEAVSFRGHGPLSLHALLPAPGRGQGPAARPGAVTTTRSSSASPTSTAWPSSRPCGEPPGRSSWCPP